MLRTLTLSARVALSCLLAYGVTRGVSAQEIAVDAPRILPAAGAVETVDWSADGRELLALVRNDARGARLVRYAIAPGEALGTVRAGGWAFAARWLAEPGKVAVVQWWAPGLFGRRPVSRPSRLRVFDVAPGAAGAGSDATVMQGAELSSLGVGAASADALCLRVARDGGYAAAGGKLVDRGAFEGAHIGGVVTVWDLRTGKVAWSDVRTHTDIVESIAFSPDGALLASVGKDQLIRLWRLADGECVSTLIGAAWGGVRSVRFSPDGTLLASGGNGREEGGRVRLWSVATGRVVHGVGPHALAMAREGVHVAFAADGARLFAVGRVADRDKPRWQVRAVDVASGRVAPVVLAEHAGHVRCVELSRDGGRLAVGTAARGIFVVDVSQ